MKKLKLQLDDLRIDSFQTSEAETPEGTVFGEQCTCPGVATCDGSCNCGDTAAGPTCNASCHNSCVAYETCDIWTCGGTCYYETCNCNRRTDFC